MSAGSIGPGALPCTPSTRSSTSAQQSVAGATPCGPVTWGQRCISTRVSMRAPSSPRSTPSSRSRSRTDDEPAQRASSASGWWSRTQDRLTSCSAAVRGQASGMNKTSFLGDKPINRIGFGAMQLAGPGVFGPPRDPDAARAVLRRAIELGVDHIDTAQYYGPDVVNDLIRESLYPYPENLKLVTKVGGRRDDQGALAPGPDSRRAARRRGGQPPVAAGGADGPRQPASDERRRIRRRPRRAARHARGYAPRRQARPDRHQRGRYRHRAPRARSRRHRRGPERLQPRQPFRGGRARAVHRARDRVRAVLPARFGVRRRPQTAGGGSRHRRRRRAPRDHASLRSRSPGCSPATSGCC